MGVRTSCKTTDFSSFMPEEVEVEMKEAAEISMGTEVSEEDVANILMLVDQVISLSEYRAQLWEYLKNRMQAIAPNLSVMVGELVGARLIAHAGSLMNLAKQPASTVQILGAEKALFRALKAKHDTPKYGLIYHAQLVGQAQPKHKGKISRVLAAKCALSIRVDALGDTDGATIGVDARQKVEERMRQLEGKLPANGAAVPASNGKSPVVQMYAAGDSSRGYSAAADSTMFASGGASSSADADAKAKAEKKAKKAAKLAAEAAASGDADAKAKAEKAAKKAAKLAAEANGNGDANGSAKKRKGDDGEGENGSAKKKKKKDKE